jgi:endonuclease/exonuclease/phosphatase family metal-dependent hydrolase
MVYTGAGRDDGQQKGEYCALFIDTSVFSIQENFTFWLSETTEKPSVGWDAALPRIATFVKVHHKESSRNIWVCNTHFDHMGKLARSRSAALISEKVSARAADNAPVVIMGDLNCEPHEEPWKELSEKFNDSRISSETPVSGPVGTFQAFGKEDAQRRIDYIFVRNLRVISQKHLDQKRPGGRFPSDHFPVTAEVSFF